MLVESVDVPIPLFVRPFPSTLTPPPKVCNPVTLLMKNTVLPSISVPVNWSPAARVPDEVALVQFVGQVPATPLAFATVSVVAVDDTILNAPLFAPVRNPAIVIEQGGVRQAEAIDAAGNVPVYTVFPPDAFATAVSRNAAGIIIGELRYTFDGSPRRSITLSGFAVVTALIVAA